MIKDYQNIWQTRQSMGAFKLITKIIQINNKQKKSKLIIILDYNIINKDNKTTFIMSNKSNKYIISNKQ